MRFKLFGIDLELKAEELPMRNQKTEFRIILFPTIITTFRKSYGTTYFTLQLLFINHGIGVEAKWDDKKYYPGKFKDCKF